MNPGTLEEGFLLWGDFCLWGGGKAWVCSYIKRQEIKEWKAKDSIEGMDNWYSKVLQRGLIASNKYLW